MESSSEESNAVVDRKKPEIDKLNLETNTEIDLTIDKKWRLNNNDETKSGDEMGSSKEEECGFLCRRLSFGKSTELKDSDKTEEVSERTFHEEEQDSPMDASIKSLNGCVNSFINRLQIPPDSLSLNSQESPSKDTITGVSQSQRTPVSKPSFLITDILSDSKKERPGSNLLIDPRALALQHRMFLDRPLTGSSCSTEQGCSGMNRYSTDNESDNGDDSLDQDGMYSFLCPLYYPIYEGLRSGYKTLKQCRIIVDAT